MKGLIYPLVLCILFWWLLIGVCCGQEIIDVDKYADAIFWAEGGYKTSHPYGILSVKCEGLTECREICKNTIRNNVKRYNEYGYKNYTTYLNFLASRYAPIGAGNDPANLNKNWIKNVQYFINNPKEVK